MTKNQKEIAELKAKHKASLNRALSEVYAIQGRVQTASMQLAWLVGRLESEGAKDTATENGSLPA